MSEGANEPVGGGGRVAAQGAKVPRAERLRGSLIDHSQRMVFVLHQRFSVNFGFFY